MTSVDFRAGSPWVRNLEPYLHWIDVDREDNGCDELGDASVSIGHWVGWLAIMVRAIGSDSPKVPCFYYDAILWVDVCHLPPLPTRSPWRSIEGLWWIFDAMRLFVWQGFERMAFSYWIMIEIYSFVGFPSVHFLGTCLFSSCVLHKCFTPSQGWGCVVLDVRSVWPLIIIVDSRCWGLSDWAL